MMVVWAQLEDVANGILWRGHVFMEFLAHDDSLLSRFQFPRDTLGIVFRFGASVGEIITEKSRDRACMWIVHRAE